MNDEGGGVGGFAISGERSFGGYLEGGAFNLQRFFEPCQSTGQRIFKAGHKKRRPSCLWSPNRWEWIVTEFAIAKIGAILVSVDPNAQRQQLEYLLAQSDSRALIMAEGLKGSEYLEIVGQLPDLPELKHLVLMADQDLLRDNEMGDPVAARSSGRRSSSCAPRASDRGR